MTTIALNQLLPTLSPAANFKTMKEAVRQNAEAGARMAIFPENFLHGVLRNRGNIAQAANDYDRWIDAFKQLAKEHAIALIPGTLPSKSGSKLLNSTVYINQEGEVTTTYSKNNLWLSERGEYESSSEFPMVFNSPIGKAAIVICWDIFNPDAFKAAVSQGAEWIIIPSFWSINQSNDLRIQRGTVAARYPGVSDSKTLDYLIRARTVEYNCGIVFCNFAGVHVYEGATGENKATSANRTQVIGPCYNVFDRLANRKEATLLCEVGNISQTIADLKYITGDATIYYLAILTYEKADSSRA